MGTVGNVKLGPCNVSFGGSDLGYSQGGVLFNFNIETIEIVVDQEDSPIRRKVTQQNAGVVVPLAETNLSTLASLLPSASYAAGVLTVSGEPGEYMDDLAQELILTPVNGSDSETLTLFKAMPIPELSVMHDKTTTKIYAIRFVALQHASGLFSMGA